MIEGAVVRPALRGLARLPFLLYAYKGKRERKITGKGVGAILILAGVCLASQHVALMATVPSDEQGRVPCQWKIIEKENLISLLAVYRASYYHWLCRGSPGREWDHDLIKQLWP